MKKKIFFQKLSVLLVAMVASFELSTGQTDFNALSAAGCQEKVALFTDREIYCVGEPLFFRAYNISDPQLRSIDWSRVLYAEIITPDGKPVYQAKYRYDSAGTSGAIIIPEDVLTGNYYFRAYTKWMRNFSPYSYSYQIIQIINPYNKELLKPQSDFTLSVEKFDQDSSGCPYLMIKTDKSSYHQREEVTLGAWVSKNKSLQNPYSIAVVKSDLVKYYTGTLPKINNVLPVQDYIPETRSISFTGKVLNQKDSLPIPYMHVSLSILTPSRNTFATLTDKKGCFYFSLPDQEGEAEVFVSLKNPDPGFEPVILVDNDFCSKEVKLPFIPFAITEDGKHVLNELIFNSQIAKKYKTLHPAEKLQDSVETVPFYSSSFQSVYFDEYILLPTMEDYFNEFLPNVVIRKKEKTKYFRILGPYSELSIYEPLVLVDNVVVYNVDWILSINPKKVSRIDKIEKPYILGNICYGGLIHIISSGRDFAGVNLPSSGQFFKLTMYAFDGACDDCRTDNPKIPDVRNTLYWNPEVHLSDGHPEEFIFHTGDVPGEYTAIMVTMDGYGKKLTTTCRFTVE